MAWFSQFKPDYNAMADDLRGEMASATDLVNSWARELGVEEAQTEMGLRDVINRVWAEASRRMFDPDRTIYPPPSRRS